jgi:hypothetical protein
MLMEFMEAADRQLCRVAPSLSGCSWETLQRRPDGTRRRVWPPAQLAYVAAWWGNEWCGLQMAIGLMKPFVSKKGAKKIRIVRKLEGLEQCTAGRLTVASLGSSYLETYST